MLLIKITITLIVLFLGLKKIARSSLFLSEKQAKYLRELAEEKSAYKKLRWEKKTNNIQGRPLFGFHLQEAKLALMLAKRVAHKAGISRPRIWLAA